ncbi:MAG TPA: flagellar basal-body MS-ring/collar protein FliF [Terriglobales bacterium]|nr:flagellar basal-body MS-ring/collar protein FliF [Terriglobales bacterium]
MSAFPLPLSRGVRLSGNRRLVTLGAAAVLVAGVWFASRWLSAPTYVTLYRDLDLVEAGTIAERLTKNGIPQKLGTGGTEVLVPVADVARARVTLAKDGLPRNGRPGLELFDKPAWGMTDFTQRVTYQRALEGELARTIGGLRGVEHAEVHLVLPVSSALHRLERPAGASVVLTMKAGVTMTPDEVQGITYIVSNSVEQLSSDNVAVMDDAGHVLSAPSTAGAAMTSRQLEIQHSVEQSLCGKIEELLATVLGPGRTRAQVAAQMSFDQVDQTVETFDPDGQVLQNEQRSETEGGATPGEGSGTQTIVNNAYQNSRRVEKSVGSVGKVTRLTVAVLLDEKALRGASPALRLENLESMVRDAVGADSTRGDRVSVIAVPFEIAAPAAPGAGGATEKPKADPIQIVEKIRRPAVDVVAIVILALIALQAVRIASQARGAEGSSPSPMEPFTAREPAQPNGNPAAALLRNRLQAESSQRPETTAQVLRAWLGDRN